MMKRHTRLHALVLGIACLGATGASVAQPTALPQLDTGEAVGLLCGRLIEGAARQPELIPDLEAAYERARADITTGRPSLVSRPAVGLGLGCGRLIEGATRQPELIGSLTALYERACLAPILALPRLPRTADISLGKAQVWDRYLEAFARVAGFDAIPEIQMEIEALRDRCLADIDGLSDASD